MKFRLDNRRACRTFHHLPMMPFSYKDNRFILIKIPTNNITTGFGLFEEAKILIKNMYLLRTFVDLSTLPLDFKSDQSILCCLFRNQMFNKKDTFSE